MKATRIDRHRSDPKKADGIVYTPPALAKFLAHQAFKPLDKTREVRILDPACGDGELLLAAISTAEKHGVHIKEIVGYDIDAGAIDIASSRLAGFPEKTLRCVNFLNIIAHSQSQIGLLCDTEELAHLDFDLVISNPPYVRTQILGATISQELSGQFGLSDRIDLYHAFAVAMIYALAPKGAIGLLCSNKFLTNRSGRAMRKLLLAELEIDEIVDLGDTKLFEAAVLPVIISGAKSPNGSRHNAETTFRSVYEAKTSSKTECEPSTGSILDALIERHHGLVSDGSRTFLIRSGTLDHNTGSDIPWNPIDSNSRVQLQTLRQSDVTELGSLGRIHVGVKTTADPIFIRSDWDQLPEDLQPESVLLRPLLTHHNIERWIAQPDGRRILYPHQDKDGRAVAIDLKEFPRASAYLEAHRDRLQSRKYLIESGRKWYEIWVPQKPALWSLPKIVFPDIAELPRFAFDRSGSIVNGDCYWMVIEDDDLAELVVAVCNSSFCTWFYDTTCGNFLYSGRRRFMAQYIKRLPIPRPTKDIVEQIRELRMAGNFKKLDTLVWSAFRLEEPSR